jgi:EAL domain-containing protein (putative c-di-GMP-specific phosphodiesterase class I)
LDLEGRLRRACIQEEISIEYQPIVDLRNGRLVGMEALSRWNNKELGIIAPLEFIPVAEDAGLVDELGRFVLRRACGECKLWSDRFNIPLRVSVNVSSREIRDPTFVFFVFETLRECNLDASCLELEITERLLLADEDRSRDTLLTLREKGVRLAIDDFGTGYSSLSYIKKFPVTTVKIDRSFVEGIPGDSEDAALGRAIIAMAHALEMDVVAEGVETAEQRNFFRLEGCDRAQGYFFDKPMPSDEFANLMQGQRTLSSSG